MSDFKRNLVESADAAARVGVLIVAVAMFAAMWESDTPTTGSDDNGLAYRAGTSHTLTRIDESTSVRNRAASQIDSKATFQTVAAQTIITQSFPVPAGIVSGDYHVVDSLGMVATLNVTPDMVSNQRSHNARNHYTIVDADRTIYFIRIHGRNTIADSRTGALKQ